MRGLYRFMLYSIAEIRVGRLWLQKPEVLSKPSAGRVRGKLLL